METNTTGIIFELYFALERFIECPHKGNCLSNPETLDKREYLPCGREKQDKAGRNQCAAARKLLKLLKQKEWA